MAVYLDFNASSPVDERVLERMIDSYQLTKRQKEAMNYAITSVRMIERMKPLIKDLGLIMKE